MIWAALLGVSSGVARREHIGLGLMVQRLPVRLKAVILISVDALVLFLFIALFFFGLEFAEKGASRQAQILGATLLIPFASIPACALLCIVQTILVGLRDMLITSFITSYLDATELNTPCTRPAFSLSGMVCDPKWVVLSSLCTIGSCRLAISPLL